MPKKRWCGAEGIENAIMLSDYFDQSFGRDYALLINEWHLLARAVFVLDTDNTIRYVEYVDNINSEPNFEAAIAAVKELNDGLEKLQSNGAYDRAQRPA